MKSEGKLMEILEAFALTGSLRAASELAGFPHHTVARYVAAPRGGWTHRAAGGEAAVDR